MINDANFDEAVLQSRKPVVVVFWTPGCAFCDALRPVLFAVARTLPFVDFVAMNAADNPRTAKRFPVDGYPALLVFRGGQVVGRRMGAGSLDNIMGWIKGRVV